MDQQPPINLNAPPPAPAPARWTAADTWLGLFLLILVVAGYLFALSRFEESRNLSMLYVATFEFLLLIPIAIIFLWRKISWQELGLRGFHRNMLVLGIGLMVPVYTVTIVNNVVMLALKVTVQAEVIAQLFDELDSPLLFAVV
ncbi:MAG TPA: hypothetical protein PK989_12235, partial [Anaerolineales bacterium]|nr:hypothetical protein [Anaerolineales bacterium]